MDRLLCARGIIVKSDEGGIKNNVITHCGLAIRIGPEWPDEADYSHNVVVQGNTLAENGDGIVVDGSGVMQNQGITITNNRLTANTGRDISVAWADGVAITGNTFSGPPARPAGAEPQPPISVRDAQNVHISGNRIKSPNFYARSSVSVGANVLRLTQDSDAPGK